MKYLLFFLLAICQLCYGQTDTATKIKSLTDRELKYEEDGDVSKALKTSEEIFDLDTSDYVVACSIAGLYGKRNNFDNGVDFGQKKLLASMQHFPILLLILVMVMQVSTS